MKNLPSIIAAVVLAAILLFYMCTFQVRSTEVAIVKTFGEADKTPFPFRLSVMKGFSMRGYVVFEIIKDPQRLARAVDFVVKGLQDGTLKPVIDKVFPFEKIADAHRHLESNTQFGKIVVTVP